MSRQLSLNAIDQFYAATSTDPVLLLLKITFPSATVHHLVNNTESITSNGQEYTAFPFNYTWPTDSEDQIPQMNVVLSNVGLDLISDLRSHTDGITAEIRLIFASNPDFYELEILDLELTRISGDAMSITATFTYVDILNTAIPSYSYTPTDFPGMFNV